MDRAGQDSLTTQFNTLLVAVHASSQNRLPSDIGNFMNQVLTVNTKKALLKSQLSAEKIAEIMIEVGSAADRGSVEPVDLAIRKRL